MMTTSLKHLTSFILFSLVSIPEILAEPGETQAPPAAQPIEASNPASTTPEVEAPAPPVAVPVKERQRPIIRKKIEPNVKRNGKIATKIGKILEYFHFRQRPYDNDVSAMHLRFYLDSLDPKHMIFLQSDVDTFERSYGTLLDNYTERGDVAPAFEIYKVFLERLEIVLNNVNQLVEAEHDFTVDEYYNPDRGEAAYPASEEEAYDLWRRRIKYELLAGKLNEDETDKTVTRIKKRYRNLLRLAWENDDANVMDFYLDGLCAAYDPHSDYHTPQEADNFDIQAIKMELSGIGVVLTSRDGYAEVVQLITGGPADKDKTKNRLKPKERFVAVAQGEGEPVDIVDMKLDKVVEMIRGQKGTKVRITVIPPTESKNPSKRREVVIVRDTVKLQDQYAKAHIYDHYLADGTEMRIGVLELPSFYEQVVEHSAKLLQRMKKEGVDGVIMDLRNNGGGLLEAAVDLTGLFIQKGPVVQIKQSNGGVQTQEDRDRRVLYSGPLIVLVGHLSASASEIVAGALQDYNRALVVGDKSTHGKGTVQSIVPLERWMPASFQKPGRLKITVSKFYRVSGLSTQKRGVIPDLQLPSTLDYYEIGERHLPNCLEFDKVQAANYEDYSIVKPFIPALQTLSQKRIAMHADFAYVLEDIKLLKKRLADRRISLNYAARKAEKEELEAQSEAREKERKERLAKIERADKIYELTIDMIDKGKPLKLKETIIQEDEVAEVTEKDPDSDAANNTPESESLEADTEEVEDAEAFDPHLEETINIMTDYAEMLRSGDEYLTTQKNGKVNVIEPTR